MSAPALLDVPRHLSASARPADAVVFAGLALGLEVTVRADQPVPAAPLRHLLAQIDDQWDVRRRRSDLHRISRRPEVMVAVSPLTLLLARRALTAVRLTGSGVDSRIAQQCLLDVRHGRVGLDRAATAVAVRLAPAVAADVLADFCLSSGATAGQVRVGDTVRQLGQPVPAWLEQVARESECASSARQGA